MAKIDGNKRKEHKFLKGAFVEVPVNNKKFRKLEPIYFQFNPETLERTKSGQWTSAQSQRQKLEEVQSKREFSMLKKKKIKAGFVPAPEKIDLTLRFDSTEKVLRAPSKSKPAGIPEGILPELAALEGLMKKISAEFVVKGKRKSPNLQRTKEIPLVLFVWGSHRVIPVTLLSMTITEQKFDYMLTPIRAEVKVSLQVLEEEDAKLNDWASNAYKFTEEEKEAMKEKFLRQQNNPNAGVPGQKNNLIEILKEKKEKNVS